MFLYIFQSVRRLVPRGWCAAILHAALVRFERSPASLNEQLPEYLQVVHQLATPLLRHVLLCVLEALPAIVTLDVLHERVDVKLV